MNAVSLRNPLRIAAVLLACSACRTTAQRYDFTRPSMGTELRLVFYADSPAAAERAADAAFACADALEAIFSDYDPASEVTRLVARAEVGEAYVVSDELRDVLELSLALSRATSGAFDITVGPYVRLWRRALRQAELPSAQRLAAARAAVGYEHLALAGGRVTFARAGVRLDFGGIAKGFIVDAVRAELARSGCERALVDGGGDLALGAAPPGASGWRVELSVDAAAGDEVLELAQVSIATSGDALRFVEIDGVRYSHIVDPRTGLGVSAGQAATVIAPSGAQADALASALCVLTPDEGLELIEALPNVEARIVERNGTAHATSGFPR